MNKYKKAVAALRKHLEADEDGLRLLHDVTLLANEARQQVSQARTQAEEAVQSKATAVEALRAAELEIDRLKSERHRERDLRQQRERDVASLVREAAETQHRPRSVSGIKRPLPLPNAEISYSDDGKPWTEERVRGLTQNPIYCGLAGWPALIPTEQWIRTNLAMIEEEGTDQFLVNMVHLLKTTFGTVEDDGYPDFYAEDEADDGR